MTDYIDRQAAIDAINRAVTKEVARWSVKELPSAEVEPTEEQIQKYILDHNLTHKVFEPVKRGKWIVEHGVLYGHGKDVHYGDLWHCSECGRRELDVEGWDYCPTCGAKMLNEKEGADHDRLHRQTGGD